MKNLWDRLSHSHQELITQQTEQFPSTVKRTTDAFKNNVLWSNLEIGDVQNILTCLNISLGDQTMYMVYYGDGIVGNKK